MKKGSSINKFITFGLCVGLAYVLACCIVLGSYNKKQVLQPGRIYTFSQQALQQEGEGIRFDKERKCLQVTEDEAVIVFNEIKTAKTWNYLFVNVFNCSAGSIPVQIDCYNRDGVVFYTVDSQFLSGDNYVTLDSSQACKYFAIKLLNVKGVEFSFGELQLRTKLPVSMKKIAWITILLSIVLFLLTTILLRSSKIKSFCQACDLYIFQNVKDVIEYIYTELGKHFYLKVQKKRWYKKREGIQVFLFVVLFFLQFLAAKSGIYAQAKYYHICVLVFCVILLLSTVLILGDGVSGIKKDSKRNWLWTAFWLAICISDMLVDKYYQYIGWVMLIVVGFFLYWWRQMENPKRLLDHMILGLRIAFLPIAVYSVISGVRMTEYAVFLLFVFGYCFIQKKKWWDGIGMILSVYLIYKGVILNLSEESFAITRSFYDQCLIWFGYLRKLNCFGHRERALYFFGQKWYPSNGILEIVFRYGIFVGVFYIGLLLQSVKMLIDKCCRLHEKKENCLFAAGVIVIFCILNLLISLEAPFLSPIWVMFYLLLGMGLGMS